MSKKSPTTIDQSGTLKKRIKELDEALKRKNEQLNHVIARKEALEERTETVYAIVRVTRGGELVRFERTASGGLDSWQLLGLLDSTITDIRKQINERVPVIRTVKEN